MAVHFINHPELLASDLVVWKPMHCRAQQGRLRQSYLSMLLKEVGTNSKEDAGQGYILSFNLVVVWGYC